MELLSPTEDITFKLLFARYNHILRDMIEAVLGPETRLREVTVLNPEPPRTFPGDKEIILDLRIRLDDGREVDLEMQTSAPSGTKARFLYYWARCFTDSLPAGEDYRLLRPVISVLWFSVPLLPRREFHSTFRILETERHERLCDHLEIHVLELPKLDLAAQGLDARLLRWARFLRAQSREDFDALAAEDPMMNEAVTALEELSADPEVQRLVRERREAHGLYLHMMAASEAAGEARGKAEELRENIRELCDVFGLPADPVRLEAMEVEQLRQVFGSLLRERTWPEGM